MHVEGVRILVNVADVVLAVVVVLMLLMVLGVMREVLILRGHVTALSQLITHPPAPSYLGAKLPHVVVPYLGSVSQSGERSPHVVLYLSKGCGSCASLIADLRTAIDLGQVPASDISCIVGAQSEGDEIYSAVVATGCRTTVDAGGEIYDVLELRGTPTQLAMWTDTAEVFDYHLGGDMQWIRERLANHRNSIPATSKAASLRATST